MPKAPPRGCRAGCPHLQPCPIHGRKPWPNRRSIARQARGYDAQHERLRAQVLREQPICAVCSKRRSTIADHVVPLYRGGQTVRGNLQGLCEPCSRAKTGTEGASALARLASGHQAAAKGEGLGSPVAQRPRDFAPLTPRGRR